MRARLALAASGLYVQLREIVLRDKPASMLLISPKGTVPVLLLPDQTVLEESLDIMRWALGQADPQALLPSDQTLMWELIAMNDGVFKQSLDRYKYPPRYQDEHQQLSAQQFAELHRDQAAVCLQQLSKRLEQSHYLLGDTLSMADLAIAPFVRQYAHTDIDWFRAQSWTALIRWLDAFLVSPRFAQVMHKYAPWQIDDEVVVFPPTP